MVAKAEIFHYSAYIMFRNPVSNSPSRLRAQRQKQGDVSFCTTESFPQTCSFLPLILLNGLVPLEKKDLRHYAPESQDMAAIQETPGKIRKMDITFLPLFLCFQLILMKTPINSFSGLFFFFSFSVTKHHPVHYLWHTWGWGTRKN